MSDFLKLVGEQLRKIREAKRLTQAQVAEKTGKDGFSKSRVSDIERGQTNISLKTLETMMQALDISPGELFNFQTLYLSQDIEDKKMMVDLHKFTLMERDLEEVKYVVRTTKDFLETLDGKRGKKSSFNP
ncbi:helix-turn-helix transcriptional regulator [Saccharibacillus sp. CPCC 101409]|uniref:helix-turn-helix domain-containing protein n=1 Tax=Saccharibacillus sp. CPCC 101409 TaxID=3058041 RepID=UPI002672E571|nr:helix-turn-helix transcriptional regulator [Saccharibacillus sp. CPCC 101409]MDO3409892.1 helix-turn-helix transcriptional regulator [Saccharibacillus sp. CPCC 101409]